MNYVSIDSVVEEAMTVVGAGNDSELIKVLARQWVWRFKQSLPVTEDEIKVCTLIPKNLIAKKPNDLRRHLELAFYDASGNYIPAVYHAGKERIFPANFYPSATNADPNIIPRVPVDYSEDQFAYYLGSNGDDVATIYVRYYAYPLDVNGLPLISEDEVQGCIYYIRFCASMRMNDNQSAIAENERRFKREADILRAKKKAATLSNDEARRVASIRSSILPRFNKHVY